MVDFAALYEKTTGKPFVHRDPYEGRTVSRITGVRTRLPSGEPREVELVVELRDGHSGKVFAVVEGWVTGYESFYVEDMLNGPIPLDGWGACAGTDHRWDRLMIPFDQMQKAFKELGIKGGC